MAIVYVTFRGKHVSRRWNTVLTRAVRDGVHFQLDSGHRTLREQARMFRQNMHLVGGRWVPRPGRPLTAFPSPTAPHIRIGRADHALDINENDGGARRVADWLHKHGGHPTFPIPGENWHLELPRRDLRRLARKLR